ncbi:hypothetical protein A5756_00760 [Mycobacterium sp. 852002-53434_SCH5985345]|nr:hypothetical protein A5756_00760 [Mycobacterium sp. 852002-53434_SCH5985345]
MNAATTAIVDLLAELAANTPALPRAACRRHRQIFDSTEPDDIATATQICQHCPELAPCREWADTQAPRTLTGVVAAVDRTPGYARRRTTKKENTE